MSIQYIFVFGGKIIQEGKTDVKTPVIKTNIPAFLPGVWNPVKGGPELHTILRPRLTGARTRQRMPGRVSVRTSVRVLRGFLTEHLLRMLLSPPYWDISHKKPKAFVPSGCGRCERHLATCCWKTFPT